MKYIGEKIKKIDAVELTSGKPVYTDDIVVKNALVIKILHSPHAFAEIESIDITRAKRTEGIEAIFTYKDVPQTRFSKAGQSYPIPSPYDSLILDKYVRYVGDAVALVVAENEEIANKAMKLIKVTYKVLEPVLDFETAMTSNSTVHPEDNYKNLIPFNADVEHNILANIEHKYGDTDKEFENCDIVFEETFYTQAQAHTMLETQTAFATFDEFGKLKIVSSTQVPFHVRRVVSQALDIPISQVRVVKPRIGGGFGAKQTASMEFYPAFVTYKTGKPSKLVYSRTEAFETTTTRHAMRVTVKLGGTQTGEITAMEIKALSDTGAYGEHGTTVIGLVGEKTLGLYNKHIKAQLFKCQVVYTNKVSGAAFRGYGATQGFFAVESCVNKYAHIIHMDPTLVREKNIIGENEQKKINGQMVLSTRLKNCIEEGKKLIDWDNRYGKCEVVDGKVRSIGMAIAMQGSGIAGIGTANVEIRLNEGGSYTLMHGATDMGTGADTILAQMAAEILQTSIENINIHAVDTDISPYDPGSYASSSTYVAGNAVCIAAKKMYQKILKLLATEFESEIEYIHFDGNIAECNGKQLTLADISYLSFSYKYQKQLVAQGSFGSNESPAPFMAGFADVEIDIETGKVTPIDYYAIVDCGTVINEALAKVQVEGGIVQSIGLALFEEVHFNKKGKMITNNFMQYKIPTRQDAGKIFVEFQESYEPTGPFGAKSVGEIVCSTPAPAIQDAIFQATKVFIKKLPMTPESIFMEIQK